MIIQALELSYVSNQWIPYKLTCVVVGSTGLETGTALDPISETPDTQVGDILNLLQGSYISPTSEQVAALAELAAMNYDVASPGAIQQASELVASVNIQIVTQDSCRPKSWGIGIGCPGKTSGCDGRCSRHRGAGSCAGTCWKPDSQFDCQLPKCQLTMAQTIVTWSGTTLFHVASEYLGDATQWPRIAIINNIQDPFLTPPMPLQIPNVLIGQRQQNVNSL